MPSLSSPNSSLPEEELTSNPLLAGLGLGNELNSGAPFISLDPKDFPLLDSGDDRVMWGALPEHLTLHKRPRAPSACPVTSPPKPPVVPVPEHPSSLAKLLEAPTQPQPEKHVLTPSIKIDTKRTEGG